MPASKRASKRVSKVVKSARKAVKSARRRAKSAGRRAKSAGRRVTFAARHIVGMPPRPVTVALGPMDTSCLSTECVVQPARHVHKDAHLQSPSDLKDWGHAVASGIQERRARTIARLDGQFSRPR